MKKYFLSKLKELLIAGESSLMKKNPIPGFRLINNSSHTNSQQTLQTATESSAGASGLSNLREMANNRQDPSLKATADAQTSQKIAGLDNSRKYVRLQRKGLKGNGITQFKIAAKYGGWATLFGTRSYSLDRSLGDLEKMGHPIPSNRTRLQKIADNHLNAKEGSLERKNASTLSMLNFIQSWLKQNVGPRGTIAFGRQLATNKANEGKPLSQQHFADMFEHFNLVHAFWLDFRENPESGLYSGVIAHSLASVSSGIQSGVHLVKEVRSAPNNLSGDY